MMLLFEAKKEIDDRLSPELRRDYEKTIPEYFMALEIAQKAIEAQIRLTELLNDWTEDSARRESERGETFSPRLCRDMVRQFSIFAKFDEDGILMDEE